MSIRILFEDGISVSGFFSKSMVYIFFLIVAGYSAGSLAIPPPVRVYRADFREPAEVFRSGFTSWGENRDLLRHIIGDSSRDRSDAFISTTSNWDSVRQIVVDLLFPREIDSTIWIYSIRPNRAFYDVNGSLLHSNLVNSNNNMGPQSLYAYVNFASQEEFAAERLIPSAYIEYAQQARHVLNPDGTEEVVISNDIVRNPSYIDGAPGINPGYINATAPVDGLPLYYMGDLNRNPIQATFDVEGCSDHILRRRSEACKRVPYVQWVTESRNKLLSIAE